MLSHSSVRIFVCLLLAAAVVNGQPPRQPIFSHPLTIHPYRGVPERSNSPVSIPETTNVLVAMVSFQVDNNPGTTGNGNFDTSSTRRIVDPPPHDRSYVQDHMKFLENYFRKVSDGKRIVRTTVLDSVYRVPHEMAYYARTRTSTDNIGLGRLVEDAWKKVDSVSPGIPYEQYDAFIILHAGVGHDVDLVSLYGYDPTPYDLPSLYLNLRALQALFGSSYRGVQVRDTATFITNSIIIPETENRVLQSIVGSSLLELGINGLLVASVGSHLGLPDLFDTKTGRSGIGRFGLMDGQSIFSWNGIFPPEPSAWEKYFLGWVDPITLTAGDTQVVIPAGTINHAADTVYRIPISAREYFLLENRNRDANLDSARITIVYNGSKTDRIWARDTVGFNAFFQDSLYGVVTDVDEFDFSLPGAIDPSTGEWFNGGLLIWHIDEDVINANYDDNTVNADPTRRGVNLMEADGSQDIGQAYAFLTPGSGSEDGTRLDFWYARNRSPLRLLPNGNAFTPTSHPSSMSNRRGNSHITVKDFSERAPRMTARVQIGDEHVAPLAGFPKNVHARFHRNSLSVLEPSPGSSVLLVATDTIGIIQSSGLGHLTTEVPTPSSLFGWNVDGSPLIPNGDSSGFLVAAVSNGSAQGRFLGKVGLGKLTAGPEAGATIGGYENQSQRVHAWTLTDADHNLAIDTVFSQDVLRNLTTSPVISDSFIAYGASGGIVYLLSHDGSRVDSVRPVGNDSSDIVSLSLLTNPGSYVAVTADGSVGLTGVACILPAVASANKLKMKPTFAVVGTISSTVGKQIVLASRDGNISATEPCTLQPARGFPVSTGGEIANSPSLADIDGDGQKDIVVFSGNKIFAINAAGAVLDNFPITVSSSKSILSSPIVADVNGDGTPDIIAVTQEGLIVAYNKTGVLLDGFPIQAGTNGGSTPVAFYTQTDCLSCTDICLAVASDDGNVYAWRTGTLRTGLSVPPKQPWPQQFHDAQNTGIEETPLVITPRSNEFFPKSLAYNWPNPVGKEHGYKTHIRYYLRDNANVTITIFDLAGDMVTQFKGPGIGGLDNEIEWDVSSIQSGIYFAHIDAQGGAGSGNTVIKVAVVK